MPAFRLKHLAVHFLPVQTRMPLKFGAQVVTEVTCARVMAVVENHAGHHATGWGETPLSIAWVWPSTTTPWLDRESALRSFTLTLAHRAVASPPWNHPIEWASALIAPLDLDHPSLPLLAKLCCLSPFDLAVWDAFGVLLGKPVFDLLDHPLDPLLGPASSARASPISSSHRSPACRSGTSSAASTRSMPRTSTAPNPMTAIRCCSATGSTETG
jgi:hypothetical protein